MTDTTTSEARRGNQHSDAPVGRATIHTGMTAALTLIIATVLLCLALYQQWKPLPDGLSMAGPERLLLDPRLLIDHTWHDRDGNGHLEHEIFDEILRLIGQAQRLIVLDMFLFNASGDGETLRPLHQELTEALLQRRHERPDLPILVITDPFNTQYGGVRSPELEQLRAADIPVIETPLQPLRDSNPLWSTLWRVCCQWFGNRADGGWLPTPINDDKVPLRSYLALLNFKANHRKVLVVDEGADWRGLISSGNPHYGSSRHSNIALSFAGPAALDLLDSERAVARLAGRDLPPVQPRPTPDRPLSTDEEATQGQQATRGQIVTEGKIRAAALAMIAGAARGDRLDIAMFYLSHRGIVEALIAARQRDVIVRVLLDPNRDAFGMEKDGVPNRPMARDLHRAGIPVRWSNTHGEQFHTKAMMRRDRNGSWQLLLGSANFTRRNLDDYNLETNILLKADTATAVSGRFSGYFEHSWQGAWLESEASSSAPLSLDYEAWRDDSWFKYWRYRVMEATGLSTF